MMEKPTEPVDGVYDGRLYNEARAERLYLDDLIRWTAQETERLIALHEDDGR